MPRLTTLMTSLFVAAVAVNAQLPSTLPPSCTSSACQSLITKLNDPTTSCLTDPTCLCSADTANGVEACYQCDIQSGSLDKKTADAALSQYIDGCKQAGHPVSISSDGLTSISGIKMSSVVMASVALGGAILL
ncbi:hypothetical protein CVT24_008836 [Panaeolus cyanescens]|uniref:Extracellular membrane protein CFEM domain-containing protein n=1 Tax=Panaeolus cyanescens TaxID=181874 RepID=A0A409VKC0_9AGAR|nr:hypothetical protein CVT24_008836 [Panaeolus cyanescens]